ncbi:PIN domain-containing protein [Candidatus Gottesmanbacteria bacterium]|nr:PIN domain-containing protein [Candidatus Gottesmanbacteria bacterium]
MIFLETSFLISLFVDADSNHQKARIRYPSGEKGLVTSEDNLKEALTVISQRRGRTASIDAYQQVIRDCDLLPVSSERFRAGLNLFLNPKLQKDISLIDCITAAICKELKIKKILTFDYHFKSFGLHLFP